MQSHSEPPAETIWADRTDDIPSEVVRKFQIVDFIHLEHHVSSRRMHPNV